MGGSPNGSRPTSDLAIHLAVHTARRDIGAVVHAHLPASMALTLAGEIPDPAALPETALLLPRLPFVPFGAMGSEDLVANMIGLLGRCERQIQDRMVSLFAQCDPDYGSRVADGLGIPAPLAAATA